MCSLSANFVLFLPCLFRFVFSLRFWILNLSYRYLYPHESFAPQSICFFCLFPARTFCFLYHLWQVYGSFFLLRWPFSWGKDTSVTSCQPQQTTTDWAQCQFTSSIWTKARIFSPHCSSFFHQYLRSGVLGLEIRRDYRKFTLFDFLLD